jgi:ribose 5-phosphate isomerase B
MKIIIGSDHAGFELKQHLIPFLKDLGYEVLDQGTYSEDSVDYPDFAHKVCEKVLEENIFGIVICGSGQGVNMAANKHKGIRSALCWNTDLARLARQHNNANVLALAGRFTAHHYAKEIVKTFLNTPFEGGRHERRVQKIDIG